VGKEDLDGVRDYRVPLELVAEALVTTDLSADSYSGFQGLLPNSIFLSVRSRRPLASAFECSTMAALGSRSDVRELSWGNTPRHNQVNGVRQQSLKTTVEFIWDWDDTSRSLLLTPMRGSSFEVMIDDALLDACTDVTD